MSRLNNFERNSHLLFKLLILCFLLIIFSSSVFAWGVLPSRQYGEFTDKEQTFSVTLRNTDNQEGFFRVKFEGELSPYAYYPRGNIYLSKDQGSATISFSLKAPKNLPPGKNVLEVKLEQLPNDDETTTVRAVMTLVSKVVIDVPYEGNNINVNLKVDQSDVEIPTRFTIGVINKGDEVVPVWADIIIKGPTNEPLASWRTDKITLPVLGNSKLETFWENKQYPGLYYAEVTVHYAEKQVVLREQFIVGSSSIIAERISSDNFKLGEIVPMDVVIKNNWNEEFDSIYADVFVLTEDGKIVQSFKTSPNSIDSLSYGTLNGYWDTKDLIVGDYTLNIVINFDGKSTQTNIPVHVSVDKIEMKSLITGQVTGGKVGSGNSQSDSGSSQFSLLLILVFILVVTNIFILIYFRNMKGKGGKVDMSPGQPQSINVNNSQAISQQDRAIEEKIRQEKLEILKIEEERLRLERAKLEQERGK